MAQEYLKVGKLKKGNSNQKALKEYIDNVKYDPHGSFWTWKGTLSFE